MNYKIVFSIRNGEKLDCFSVKDNLIRAQIKVTPLKFTLKKARLVIRQDIINEIKMFGHLYTKENYKIEPYV